MPRLKTKTNFKTKSFRILKCSKNLYSVDKSVQARNGLPFFSSQMIAKVGGAPYTRVRRIHENLRYIISLEKPFMGLEGDVEPHSDR